MTLLQTLILVSALVNIIASTCITGWTRNIHVRPGVCFQLFTAKKTYAEAVEECKKHNGFLALPTKSQEHSHLAQKTRQNTDKQTWIGINHLTGAWTYADGSTMTSYGRWSGLSTATAPSTNTNGDCVFIDDDNRGKWTNGECTNKYPYLCEYGGTYLEKTTSSSDNGGDDGKSGTDETDYVPIIIGSLVGVGLLLFIILFFVRRSMKKRKGGATQQQGGGATKGKESTSETDSKESNDGKAAPARRRSTKEKAPSEGSGSSSSSSASS